MFEYKKLRFSHVAAQLGVAGNHTALNQRGTVKRTLMLGYLPHFPVELHRRSQDSNFQQLVPHDPKKNEEADNIGTGVGISDNHAI